MPSPTFFHLKPEKRKKMDTVLLDIFYNQPVSQVKVSQIVEETEISRGAFYKYFLDLEDAYLYTVRESAKQIHGDILKFIYKDQSDFFAGIERYLEWCSELDVNDENWKKLKLCTQTNLLSNTKREPLPGESSMIKQWEALLAQNQFNISDADEAVSFLYFIMALVMDALTDFIVNQWTTAELLKDFRFRTKWLLQGSR